MYARAHNGSIGTTTLGTVLATLILGLGQLQGLMDSRPDLFYVRVTPNIAYAEMTTTTVQLVPDLVSICTCESGQGTGEPQQFDVRTGKVLRGYVNSRDRGMCQVNIDYHGKTASTLGYDLETRDGNILFSNYLFQREGSTPWNASRACWHKKSIPTVDNS